MKMIMKSTFKSEIFINATKLWETPLFPRGIVGQRTCLEETPLFPGARVGQQICPDKRPSQGTTRQTSPRQIINSPRQLSCNNICPQGRSFLEAK
jgi:hypothetical protein